MAGNRSMCYAVTFKNVFLAIGALALIYTVYVLTEPGKFTDWSEWSNCTVTCGGGKSFRTRTCTNPKPGLMGTNCQGPAKIEKTCNRDLCAVNGGYSEWEAFGKCDKTCGGGEKIRKRYCTNPVPSFGGSNCIHLGRDVDIQACNTQPCPVNGGYSNWGEYSGCELPGGKTCGKGKKVRARQCNNPAAQHGGKACEGPDKEEAECNIICPLTVPPTKKVAANITQPIAATVANKP